MKYLVLRRKKIDVDDPFMELAAEGASSITSLPFDLSTEELDDPADAAKLREDHAVAEVVPSIPFRLIKPVSAEDQPSESSDSAGGTTGENDEVGVVDQAAASGEAPLWGIAAVLANASARNGAGTKIAVLDTGIDASHKAFQGLSFPADRLMDFTVNSDGVSGAATDVNGHGTHVAGTIFGRDVDGKRIGVAPGVSEVFIGKVLNDDGAGSTESIYSAIYWALRCRVDVISMSLGVDFPGFVRKQIEQDIPPEIAASRALDAFYRNALLFESLFNLVQQRAEQGRGPILVAATGNESQREKNPKYTVFASLPGVVKGVLSVGAIKQTGDPQKPYSVANFSNTGCRVCAPGEKILSARVGGGLSTLSGTSMATPHVAGVALLWTQELFPSGARPREWASDVVRRIEGSTLPISDATRLDVGLGLVQSP